MASLEEIRAKLLAQQQKTDQAKNGSGSRDNAVYAFWNTPEGQTSQLRFLPDADPDNIFFWVERLVIKLPFQGVKGEHNREVEVQVPCMEMYGESCPILAETRPWWKDPSLKDMASKYWKKKSYIFQGFVVNSAFEEKQIPENPIRRFVINSSIFDIIKNSLVNPEFEDSPTDYMAGRDFKLSKTNKGGFANYSSSSWSFKTRALSDTEQGALSQYGLWDLKKFLPKKPEAAELAAIKEMFAASVNDEEYDPERWGQFYKPFGTTFAKNNTSTGNSSAPVAPWDDTSTVVPSAPAASAPVPVSQGASEALARLRGNTTPAAPTAPAASGRPDPSEILRRLRDKAGN